MQEFGERWKKIARRVSVACVLVLLAPSLAVWGLRGLAYAGKCAPGPGDCLNLPLGMGLRLALDGAWALDGNVALFLILSVIAAIGAMALRRPLLSASALLLLPAVALLAPRLAAEFSQYPGCNMAVESGRCLLWGADMGTTLHTAAAVSDMIYAIAPYSIALALVLGLLGFFFTPHKSRPVEKHNPFRFKDDA